MNNWNNICGFITIFCLCSFSSTAQAPKPAVSVTQKITTASLSILLASKENQPLPVANTINLIKQNYYSQGLGFVCKKELALEKITKVPLRIRLGSLQQCNYLEGKKTLKSMHQ